MLKQVPLHFGIAVVNALLFTHFYGSLLLLKAFEYVSKGGRLLHTATPQAFILKSSSFNLVPHRVWPLLSIPRKSYLKSWVESYTAGPSAVHSS